jgi:tetratricopeptide (TPR) repeat protein
MLEAGNADGAVPLLEGALAFEPANPLIHLNLGDAYRLQGRAKDALTQLDWVTQAAPNLAQAHYNIGLVYLFGQLDGIAPEQAAERAIGAFERCAQLQPGVRGGAEDVQELISRAKNKKAVLEAMKESSQPTEPAAPPEEPSSAAPEPEPTGFAEAEQPEPEPEPPPEPQPTQKKPSEASMSEGSMSDAP